MNEVSKDFLADFGGEIIDVRSRSEFEDSHIEIEGINTRNCPLRETDFARLGKELDGPVVVVCWKGVSSKKVAAILSKHGVKAYSLKGGMENWSV